LDSKNPLSILRGQSDILQIIWTFACEEWWNLHIERFHLGGMDEIFDLSEPWLQSDAEYGLKYPQERYAFGGCPLARIAKQVTFPPLMSLPPNSLPNQQEDYLYVNMMPFDYCDSNSLPIFCQQYWPIIETCLNFVVERGTGYLTIDERPTAFGKSQRREGLHVESPGVLPIILESNHPSISSPRFVPGATRMSWGEGTLIRSEHVKGGIFLGSNLANTTAVWNCRVRDEHGDIIAPHGSIERCRALLGPPSRILDAGELVWLTDKTPHEALVSRPSSSTPRRQFFRLVIGEVTAWFADHSTLNPTGYPVPSEVQIVMGNKYEIYRNHSIPSHPCWICGTVDELRRVKQENALREVISCIGLGHVTNFLITGMGLHSIVDLIRLREKFKTWKSLNIFMQGIPQFDWLDEEMHRLSRLFKLACTFHNNLKAKTKIIQTHSSSDDFDDISIRFLQLVQEEVDPSLSY
jgi:hypothetical protein